MLLRRIHTVILRDGVVCACGGQGSFDPTVFCSRQSGQKAFDRTHLRYPNSRSRLLLFNLDFIILGIRATAHRLFSSSNIIVPPAILRSLIHGYRCSPRYLVIVITIAIRLVQPSLYLYLVLHPVVLRISSHPAVLDFIFRCSSSLSSCTSTSRITASMPRRSSPPREGVLS